MGLSLPKSNLIFKKKCLDKWVHFTLRGRVSRNIQYVHVAPGILSHALRGRVSRNYKTHTDRLPPQVTPYAGV